MNQNSIKIQLSTPIKKQVDQKTHNISELLNQKQQILSPIPRKESLNSSPFNFTFTRIIRSKTDNSINDQIKKAIQFVNQHEEQKYSFLKTLNSHQKFHDYRSHVFQIEEILLKQTIKIQLLPKNQKIFKLQNPLFKKNKNSKTDDDPSHSNYTGRSSVTNRSKLTNNPLSYKKQEQLTQIKEHDSTSSNLNAQKNKNLNRNAHLVTEIQRQESYQEQFHRNKIQKLQFFLKNFRGGACEVSIGYQSFQNSNETKKYKITTQKIINFTLQNKNKKWIFFKVKSKGDLCMFTSRVQYQIETKKIKTQMGQTQLQKSLNKGHSLSKITKTKINTFKSMKSLRSIQLSQKHQQLQSLQQNTKNTLPLIKNKSIKELSLSPPQKKNKTISKKQMQQKLKLKKEQFQKKLSDIQKKKETIEEAKIKQIKLRSMALQAKKLLQVYQQIRRQQQKNIKENFPQNAVLIHLVKFQYICHKIIEDRQRGFQMAWRTRILTKKFTKILKNKYKDTIRHISAYKTREMVNVACLTSLFAKILNKECEDKSMKIITQCLTDSKPMLRINLLFDKSTRYRRALRVVQRSWLLKYNAKMQMFKHYVNTQVVQLLKKHPHFKHVYSLFLAQNTTHQLCYKYMGDQTSKIRSTFDDYQQKLKEIQEFKEVNKKIKQFNDNALKKYSKQYLQIPRQPCKPYDRYFRNISFLKSMVRGWFEVQYRKWAKSNQSYLKSMSMAKNQKSPQKNSFKRGSLTKNK